MRIPPSQKPRRRGGRSGDQLRREQRQRWLGIKDDWDEDISMVKCRHTENPARAIPRAKSQSEISLNTRYTENPERAIPRAKANENDFMDYQADSKRVWEEKNKNKLNMILSIIKQTLRELGGRKIKRKMNMILWIIN